jgi:Leu/Phe-tRNA-protein transferase
VTGTLPNTNDAVVALIAVAWEIVHKAASGQNKIDDEEWMTKKFDEVYKQLYNTVYGE